MAKATDPANSGAQGVSTWAMDLAAGGSECDGESCHAARGTSGGSIVGPGSAAEELEV